MRWPSWIPAGTSTLSSRDSIVRDYPYLEPADIDEALRYAAFLAEDETVEHAG